MLRALLIFAILVPGMVVAITNRYAALLLYLWFALFRPQEFTSVDLTGLKLSLILGALLVVPAVLTRVFPNVTHPLSLGSLAFLGLAVLAHFGSANATISWNWVDFMMRLLLVCLLAVTLIDSPKRLWLTIAVIAGSLGFHTAKAGLMSLLGGGTRFMEGFAGAYTDNNGYALACAMIIPFLVVTALGAPRRWLRLGAMAAVPLTAFTVVSTYSRGGVLALLAVVGGYLVLGRRKGAAAVAILLAVLALPFVPMPEGYAERVSTIRTYEEQQEESALSRLHFWQVAVAMASDNPVGVGLFNYEQVYDRYDFLEGAFGQRRSVHSSHFQVLAELGFPGLVVWILLFTYAIATIFRVRQRLRDVRVAPADRQLLTTIANGLGVSMAAFLVGGSFLAAALNDLTWLTFALVAALDRVSARLCEEAAGQSERADAVPDVTLNPELTCVDNGGAGL